MNQVYLSGNIGSDARITETKNGKVVATFSVATTEYFKETQFTEWHNVVYFSKPENPVLESLKKGTKVFVCGKIKTNEYEGRNGLVKDKQVQALTLFVNCLNEQEAIAKNSRQRIGLGANNDLAGFIEDDIPY